MANNTIMTAKNTFGDGLLMDFAPDNTQATSLTNALNATLITMNGNELSLLNDMGNGRVETAYLPEGYVPVGTCEFGDIIYIVSYNPLINKSLIGCFPSPERNISSEELIGEGCTFNADDFIEYDSSIKISKVKTNSVKKIIYKLNLNPGDKFIIYSNSLTNNLTNTKALSDYGNSTKVHNAFPKEVKVHVVAIEDSGKINYLDDNLVWYGEADRTYYINESRSNTDKPDIDSYRNLLQSGYSVFQSKVSGKLAILLELERIDGFNATYEVFKNTENNTYNIYANVNWETKNPDINPSELFIYDIKWVSNLKKRENGIYINNKNSEVSILEPDILEKNLVITGLAKYENYLEFKEKNYEAFIKNYKDYTKVTLDRTNGIPIPGQYWVDLNTIIKDGQNINHYNLKGDLIEKPSTIYDTVVNNYFHSSIYRKILTNVPVIPSDAKYPITDWILHYKIAPRMSYGLLEDLAIDQYIDFTKIGSGKINLDGYRYYIGDNLCTLLLDTSIYPEEGKGVAEIELDFYDNLGLCATYTINNRSSYSGKLTEYIPLNGDLSNYKLSLYKDGELIIHAGLKIVEGTKLNKGIYALLNNNEVSKHEVTKDGEKAEDNLYYNDAGILYSNMLYAVNVIIKYTNLNVLGEYDLTDTSLYFLEWRWLWTNLLYNEYYYNTIDFKDLKFELDFDVNVDYTALYNTKKYNNLESINKDENNDFHNLGVNALHLNGNINYKINLGLLKDYNTFNLYKSNDNTLYKNIDLKVYLGNSNISYNYLESENYNENIKPNYGETSLNYSIIFEKKDIDIWNSLDNYKNYVDTMNMSLNKSVSNTESIIYLNTNGESIEGNFPYDNIADRVNLSSTLSLDLWNLTKYLNIYEYSNRNVNQVSPLLTPENALDLGFTYENGTFTPNNIYSFIITRDKDYRPNGVEKNTGDKIQYISQWKSIEAFKDIALTSNSMIYYDGTDLGTYSNSGYKGYEHFTNNDPNSKYLIGYKSTGGSGTGPLIFSQFKNASNRYWGDGLTEIKSAYGTITYEIPLYLFFINVMRLGNRLALSAANDANTLSYNIVENVPNYLTQFPNINNNLIAKNALVMQIGYNDINGLHFFNDFDIIGRWDEKPCMYYAVSGANPTKDSLKLLISCLTLTYLIKDSISKSVLTLSDKAFLHPRRNLLSPGSVL